MRFAIFPGPAHYTDAFDPFEPVHRHTVEIEPDPTIYDRFHKLRYEKLSERHDWDKSIRIITVDPRTWLTLCVTLHHDMIEPSARAFFGLPASHSKISAGSGMMDGPPIEFLGMHIMPVGPDGVSLTKDECVLAVWEEEQAKVR